MSLIDSFQDMVAEVPDLVQPFVVALAGAVPFIEGEGAAAIGIVGGIHPVVASIAGIVGNFLCVAIVVWVSSRARRAALSFSRTRAAATVPAGVVTSDGELTGADGSRTAGIPKTKRQAKFQKAFERFGVPGVSLLGPLLLPTHFTASMLTAAGIRTRVVLIWQAVAIVAWTTILAVVISSALGAVA